MGRQTRNQVKGNKVTAISRNGTVASVAAALVEHHDKISSVLIGVTWKAGTSETYFSEMTDRDKVWLANCIRADVDASCLAPGGSDSEPSRGA